MFVKKLLAKTTVFQRTLFLEKILKEQPPLVEDLKIFLQGQRQTSVTVADYKIRFRNRLEQLDLKELLEMWYWQGEDYDDGRRYDLTTESLEETVDELIEPAEKYAANQNYAEAEFAARTGGRRNRVFLSKGAVPPRRDRRYNPTMARTVH